MEPTIVDTRGTLIPPLLRVQIQCKAGMGLGVRDDKCFVIAGMSRSENYHGCDGGNESFCRRVALDIAKDVGLQDKNLETIP